MMAPDSSRALIIGEHDDLDLARLRENALNRPIDAKWFRLGLDSSEYSIEWQSDGIPIMECRDARIDQEFIQSARWIFHKESKLKKQSYVKVDIGQEPDNDFSEREWDSLLASILLLYRDMSLERWVSPFGISDYTDRKLYLLSRAAGLGARVPWFCTGTTLRRPPKSIDALVAKAINSDEIIDEDRFFATTLLSDIQVNQFYDTRAECPSLIQERIPHREELRLYFVDNQWVRLSLKNIEHHEDSRYATPSVEIRKSMTGSEGALARLCQLLKMRFCSFDVLIDEKQREWLVDITPSGTWWWYEDVGGIDITTEIANLLEGES